MKPFAVQVAQRTCIGSRSRNEDFLAIEHLRGSWCLVLSDGAGGHDDGARAAQLAVERILTDMRGCVRDSIPRVPNPVNPAEDFADKWHDPAFRHLQLEENFWLWLEQAQEDFRTVAETRDITYLEEQVTAKFAATINADRLKEKLGLSSVNIVTRPKSHDVAAAPAKPWMQI